MDQYLHRACPRSPLAGCSPNPPKGNHGWCCPLRYDLVEVLGIWRLQASVYLQGPLSQTVGFFAHVGPTTWLEPITRPVSSPDPSISTLPVVDALLLAYTDSRLCGDPSCVKLKGGGGSESGRIQAVTSDPIHTSSAVAFHWHSDCGNLAVHMLMVFLQQWCRCHNNRDNRLLPCPTWRHNIDGTLWSSV